MSRKDDPFYSAKLPFRGLTSELENLQKRTEAFFNQNNVEHFTEHDTNANEIAHKVRIINDVPDDIERDAVRFLSEIRGALDKAINGATLLLSGEGSSRPTSPLGKTPTSLLASSRARKDSGVTFPRNCMTISLALSHTPLGTITQAGMISSPSWEDCRTQPNTIACSW